MCDQQIEIYKLCCERVDNDFAEDIDDRITCILNIQRNEFIEQINERDAVYEELNKKYKEKTNEYIKKLNEQKQRTDNQRTIRKYMHGIRQNFK